MITVRCPHCGTENPPDNRFCGMCGKALDEPFMEAPPPEVPVHGQRSIAREPEHREPASPAPAYTGGIFNLGAPAERPSRNLDYLLEDDEPRSHKGLVIGIIALLLVAGLGYLRWRTGGLAFLNIVKSGAKPPAPADASQTPTDQPNPPPESSSSAPGNTDAAAPANNPAASSPSPAPGSKPGDSATSANPPADHAAAEPAAGEHASGEPAGTDHAPANAKPTDTPPAPATAPADQPASAAAAHPSMTVTPTAPKPAESSAPEPPTPKPAKPKPSPKAPAPRPEDSVAMGERYLYGRGVTQDCARGLKYVKPAADASNPKAMITMGALYATGHCISRDLPTAFRFFALALRKDPENGPLKQNAQMVWAQMTEAERQQAIRMTQ